MQATHYLHDRQRPAVTCTEDLQESKILNETAGLCWQ